MPIIFRIDMKWSGKGEKILKYKYTYYVYINILLKEY